MQTSHQDPWGLNLPISSSTGAIYGVKANRYLFLNREEQAETGLIDFGARQYDSTAPHWLGIDPLAEKMPFISPYSYAFDNPLKFIDPDGRKPRKPNQNGGGNVVVYTESGAIGHTFVSVGSGKGLTVYTYGRYDNVAGSGKDNKSSLRSLGSSGGGVLIRLKGNDAKQFINNEMTKYDAKAFEIKNADAGKVKGYFDNQFNSTDTKPSQGAFKDSEAARVVDNYSLSGNNCTTKSCEAVRAAGAAGFGVETTGMMAHEAPIENRQIISPSGLESYLEDRSSNNGNIRDVTSEVKKAVEDKKPKPSN